MDEGKAGNVVFLGFGRAFDTISHSITLEKLASHGQVHFLLGEKLTGWQVSERGGECSNILLVSGH